MKDLSPAIKITTRYENLSEALSQDLDVRINERSAQFERSYFRSVLKKPGAEISISSVVSKNRHGRYTGNFYFMMDNKPFRYATETPFSEPLDIVNHAFKRLKEHLASLPPAH